MGFPGGANGTEPTYLHFSLSCFEEGNGNPLQCSSLENPRTRELGGLPSLGSHRVGHDWSDLAAVAAGRQEVIKFSENLLERILCFTSFNKSNLRFPITLTAKPIQGDFFGESKVLLFLCEFSYQLYFVIKNDFWDRVWWILRKM